MCDTHTMNIKIQQSEYPKIFDLYSQGYSQSKIARYYNVSNVCIERIFQKTKTATRKFSLFKDETFFEMINSEEKAYFLGLIYADGFVSSSKGSFGISLQEEDKYLIDQLKESLKFAGSVKNVGRKKPHHKDRFRIDVSSIKMLGDLSKLGVVDKKSLILRFPTEELVPIEFMPHFLRGVFDGDGSISIKTYNRKRDGKISLSLDTSITSSQDFCNGLEQFLNNQLKINVNNRCDGRSKAHSIKISHRQALIFLDFIYKDFSKHLYMKRKFEKFIKIIKDMKDKSADHTRGSNISCETVNQIIDFHLGKTINQILQEMS